MLQARNFTVACYEGQADRAASLTFSCRCHLHIFPATSHYVLIHDQMVAGICCCYLGGPFWLLEHFLASSIFGSLVQ